MKSVLALSFACLLGLSGCATPAPSPPRPDARADRPLKLVSWNMEFLAEKDGVGCEPRLASDYVAMRRIVDGLDADVIAFQEVENEAAAARVFDPARYTIVMEARTGSPGGTCGGSFKQQSVIRQAVGFAIRKGIAFERQPDVTSLMLGNKQLRSGVDVTLKPRGRNPLRLLSLHLKSGCFAGEEAKACPVLLDQIPPLEAWTDIDDGDPANADLRLADAGVRPTCDPRYNSFIDHIVLDRRAAKRMIAFAEAHYAPGEKHYSDHCPVSVTLGE